MTAKKRTGAYPLTDRELLEDINRKQDLLLAVFGLGSKQRMTPAECEAIAEGAAERFRKRMNKKKGGD